MKIKVRKKPEKESSSLRDRVQVPVRKWQFYFFPICAASQRIGRELDALIAGCDDYREPERGEGSSA